MPTRRELRTLQDRVQEARRETKRLRSELEALRKQVGARPPRPHCGGTCRVAGAAKPAAPRKKAATKAATARAELPALPHRTLPKEKHRVADRDSSRPVADEMLQYSQKLGKGIENLLNASEIDTGVSPKTAVYREDKVILYRYDAPEGAKQRNAVPLLIVYRW